MHKTVVFLTLLMILASACAGAAPLPVSTAPAPTLEASPTASPSPIPTRTPLPPTPTPVLPTLTPSVTPLPRLLPGQPLGFIQGMSMPSWSIYNYSGKLSDQSLAALRDTGAGWVAVIPSFSQDRYDTIGFDFKFTATDSSLVHAIQEAHRLGLRVMLKPQIDLRKDPDHWQADIGLTFNADQWQQWFASYTEVMLRYARLAEDNRVDLFCIGTELIHPQTRKAEWVKLAGDIRQVYHGLLTYAAVSRFGDPSWFNGINVSWWDAVDVIGIDGYFRLTSQPNPSVQALENAWQPYFNGLRQLSKTYSRPVIFTEIGYGSTSRAAAAPDLSQGTLDLQVQANAYQAVFNRFLNQDWFAGMFWWMWEDSPYQGGPCTLTHTPKDKPAENVLRQAFGAPLKELPAPVVQPVFDENNIRAFPLTSGGVPAPGFDLNWSWNEDLTFSSSPPLKDSPEALQVKYNGNAGLAFYNSSQIDTTPYQWLEFYVFSQDPDLKLNIYAIDGFGADVVGRPFLPCVDFEAPRMTPGQWTRVLIMLSHLQVEQMKIRGFAIYRIGHPKPVTVWFDRMRLVGLK